jgi:tripartite-type tricarboxylate transporter receptor subunit TctC
MRPRRAVLVRAAVLAGAVAFAGGASAQAYPAKPISFILPVPPGGALDTFARPTAQALAQRLGGTVLVENRPGADFLIAAEACAKSKPDGYTMCMLLRDLLSIAPLLRKVPYDAERGFAPVTNMVYIQNVLVAHPSLPVKTFRELVDYSKKNPTALNYTAFGSDQILMEWLKRESGLQAQFIRYKGQADAVKDFLGGRLQLNYPHIGNAGVMADINSGRMAGLVVPGSRRMAQIPGVPAFTEVGLPNLDARQWLGLFMPAGVPAEIVNRVSAEVSGIVRSREFNDKYLTPGGFDPIGGTPEEFAAFLSEDRKIGEVFAKLAPRPE